MKNLKKSSKNRLHFLIITTNSNQSNVAKIDLRFLSTNNIERKLRFAYELAYYYESTTLQRKKN